MQDHRPGGYGAAFADVYDDWYGTVSDEEATVDALVPMAGGGALELGVGTGRIAIPLSRSVDSVIGLDASAEMLAGLRAKPGSERIDPVLADMASLPFGSGTRGLVYAAFNTFFNLDSIAAQRACLGEVARILEPGGRLVIEAFVPPVGMPLRGVGVRDASDERVTVTATRHDPGNQTIAGEHVEVTPSGVIRRPWSIRYLTPPQLDELTRVAGLSLDDRFGSWDGVPFANHETHISIYRKPPIR